MGKLLQKKKNRSGVTKVKHKSRTTKTGKKKIDVFGNAIIKQNWDKKLTLTQNYQRLGLTSRLNAPTGGVEVKPSGSNNKNPSQTSPPIASASDPFHISSTKLRNKKIEPGEVQVERDPETGKILRVIRPEDDGVFEVAGRKRRRSNPLDDPLEELSDVDQVMGDVNVSHPSTVIAELEKQAAQQEEKLKHRKPRQQSKREEEWLRRLVEKYNEDTRAMARDRKLNPMQQTEADISRRLKKWKKNQG
ncbi:Nucleolar protein 16 [Myotisia sp. PD_48]|nr:Nucleolar protein 16 [Myotisia sp. PD_48]